MLGDWTRKPRTRARDVDREFVVGLLHDASVGGQLSSEEFESRLGRAYEARRVGELVELVSDLDNAPASSSANPATASAAPQAAPVPAGIAPSADISSPDDPRYQAGKEFTTAFTTIGGVFLLVVVAVAGIYLFTATR